MKRGQVLIAAIFVMVIVSLLGVIAVSVISSESIATAKTYAGIKALNVAEGGVRFTIASSLAADSDWSNNSDLQSINLGGGSFSVHYANGRTTAECTVEVTGTVNGVNRKVSLHLTKGQTGGSGPPKGFGYAMYCGRPGGGATLTVQGNAGVYGDLYYNGPLTFRNGASQYAYGSGRTIYSPAYPNVVNPSHIVSWEAAPPLDFPAWDNTYYNVITAEVGTVRGSSFPSGAINLSGQTVYYNTAVSTGWMQTITGPGTICATGTGSNGDITLNNANVVGKVRFIARNNFTYSGGVSLSYSIEVYAKGVVSVLSGLPVPTGSILYSSSSGSPAIYISNGFVSALLLAPYGQVYFNQMAIYGLIYADRLYTSSTGSIYGGIIIHSASPLQGDTKLYDAPVYVPQSVIGLTGGGSGESSLTISNWGETY